MINGVPQLEDLGDLAGKRVLVRADFNVPLRDGEITDDLRIRAALPTLHVAAASRARTVTACSHLGRPKGEPDPKYSMEPVRARLAELAPGVELLENLRFDPGETANDPAFVHELVAGQDAYVNDAFGASHRAHASIVGPPQFLPSAAGRLLAQGGRGAARRCATTRAGRSSPILGGAKVSDKLGVIDALLDSRRRADHRRRHVLHLPRRAGPPDRRLAAARRTRSTRASELLDAGASRSTCRRDITALGPGRQDRRSRRPGERCARSGVDLPDGWMGLDIGPGTAAEFTDVILDARTVLLERPDGRVRGPAVRGRHPHRRPGRGRCRGLHRGRRRRQRRGGRPVRPRPTGSTTSPPAAAPRSSCIEQGDLPGLEALRGRAAECQHEPEA